VRAAAEVEETAVAVEGDRLALGNVGEALELELSSHLAEDLPRFLAVHLDPLEAGVFRQDLAHLRFDRREVFTGERLFAAEVVLEFFRMVDPAGIDFGARPQALHRVGQHVLRAVADHRAGLAVFIGEELEAAALRERRAQIDRSAFELGADRRFGQARADRTRHVERGRAGGDGARRAVRKDQLECGFGLAHGRRRRLEAAIGIGCGEGPRDGRR
jgi:hypothetical protein